MHLQSVRLLERPLQGRLQATDEVSHIALWSDNRDAHSRATSSSAARPAIHDARHTRSTRYATASSCHGSTRTTGPSRRHTSSHTRSWRQQHGIRNSASTATRPSSCRRMSPTRGHRTTKLRHRRLSRRLRQHLRVRLHLCLCLCARQRLCRLRLHRLGVRRLRRLRLRLGLYGLSRKLGRLHLRLHLGARLSRCLGSLQRLDIRLRLRPLWRKALPPTPRRVQPSLRLRSWRHRLLLRALLLLLLHLLLPRTFHRNALPLLLLQLEVLLLLLLLLLLLTSLMSRVLLHAKLLGIGWGLPTMRKLTL